MYMSEKKIPLSGTQRSKKFYDENTEKERLRKSEYYKQKRILAGFPEPIPRSQKQKQQTPRQPRNEPTIQPIILTQPATTTQPIILPQSASTISTQTPPKKTYNTISTQTDFEPEPAFEQTQIEEPEPVVVQKSKKGISAFDKVTSLIQNIPNETPGNIKFRVDSFKTIIRILQTPTYKAFINKITTKPLIVIKDIKEAEFRGKKYSKRSILAYFNCILFLLDKYPNIKISVKNKKLYKDQSSVMSLIADEEGDEKKQKLAEAGGLPSYDEYLKRVIETYGMDKQEYLIAELYKEIKARDDLILKVVKSKAEVIDDDNYLIITEKPNADVVINSFKTISKYGEFEVKLSPELTSLIRQYIKNNKIKYNEYLFKTKSLSVTVGRMNKKLGVIGYGATNVFRKMLETDLDNSGASPEQRLQLANELKHSMATAKKSYVIKKK